MDETSTQHGVIQNPEMGHSAQSSMHEYEYQIIYKPGQLHGNMDVLSPQNKEEKPERVVMLAHMDDAPISVSQVSRWTARDVTLSQVHNYILSGWPEIQ